MTSPEFEDDLDSWLHEAGQTCAKRRIEDLPASLRQRAAETVDRQRTLHEWLWLDDQVRNCRRPEPLPGFADRVIASYRKKAGRRAWTFRHTLAWAGAAVTAVAATLLLMFSSRPALRHDAHQAHEPIASQSNVRELENDVVQDVGLAYLALARDAADALAIADRSEKTAATSNTQDSATFPTPPVAKTMRGSTDVIMLASRGISAGIKPVADSANGAFGFLWNSDATPKEQSRQ